ncbi:hypothetical protein AB0C52_16580 [Streptomyces sp. NPDC048717]|uniref:hypothetical protein n=1 Tax=Streptomyces sp. NPDC048717 TaxID=3154928 RepID=UPI00344383DC
MTDSGSTDSPGGDAGTSSDATPPPGSRVPFGGTAATADVVAAVKKTSSRLYEFTGVPGKASEPGPGVKECEGRDPKTYFQVYHPWNFKPESGADDDVAMANLKEKLSEGGWTVKDSYRDNSANKNLNLVADNDAEKLSVWIVAYSKRATPSIGITVTSACYRVPEGQTVDHF